jgi:ParB-like chromosome segregation protein Spo0J
MPTKKEKAKSKPDAKTKAKEWNVVWKDPNELTPYEKNARKNDATVPYLVNSIKRFGFRVPLVIDAKGVVVCGHTRLKAALNMGMKKVPCVVADDLTNAEIKAFRLADNKIAEMSGWDFEALDLELEELKIDFDGDMIDFGFGENSDETKRDNDKKVKENFEIIVECMDERDMQEKYEDLLGRGYTCRISTL